MVAQLELEGIHGLLSGFHFTSDNVHSPQLQPLLQAQRNISECFAPNHTNVHLTIRHWGCSTCVWSRFYNIWKMTGLTIASKIELNVSPDTLGRKKKYIFWFYVVVFLSFFGNASRSCMKYRHIPFQSTALNHKWYISFDWQDKRCTIYHRICQRALWAWFQ